MVLPLRWEATGVTGRLFPVLDADLTITPAGAGQTLITLNGAYRPPLGPRRKSATRLISSYNSARRPPAPAGQTAGQAPGTVAPGSVHLVSDKPLHGADRGTGGGVSAEHCAVARGRARH
jgi:hypothetical protein